MWSKSRYVLCCRDYKVVYCKKFIKEVSNVAAAEDVAS